MKLNEEFSVCKVAGKSFLVPLGARTMDMRKMLNLNGSALFLINALKENEYTREELLALLLETYDVDEKTAAEDACKVEHDISDKTYKAIARYYKKSKK